MKNFKCVGLVVLDRNDYIRNVENLFNSFDSRADVPRIVDTFTVIDRDVRLTLCGVDDESVDFLIVGNIELDVGWEACAAHSYKTGFSDCFAEILFVIDLGGF